MTDQTLQRTDANYPFLRYADVILIMAEASNELKGPNDEAIGLLNDVRKRSNATPRELKNYSTKSALRSAILEERSMEFAMEGDRFFDLVRWGIAEETMNSYIVVEQNKRVYYRGTRFIGGRDEYLPIPNAQYNFSEGTYVQNPGYGKFN